MLLGDLIKNLDHISNNADADIDITGICYDTRTIRKGELFTAIKGYETDGNMFIADAVKKGVCCIICEKIPEIEIPYILVKDARKALAEISAVWFGDPAKKLKIIGVTGTNGKTSVTWLIKHMIEKCSDEKAGLIGTNGNFIGDRELPTKHTTPESYEIQNLLDKMVLEGCKYVIMEVSSHALYLSRVYGIKFEIGIFTNLTPDHLDFHETIDNYADAKSLLFKSSNISVINIDDEHAEKMMKNAVGSIVTYSITDNSADFFGSDIMLHPDRIEFNVPALGKNNKTELPIPAMFSVYNALASIAAAAELKIDPIKISQSLHSYEGVKGRAEVITTGHDYTVLIDYAHTPDALQNIITSVRGYAKGKVVTLFGCGGDRDKLKRPMMGKIAAELSDHIVITTDNPRTEAPGEIINDILAGIDKSRSSYEVIENRYEAILHAMKLLKPDDVLILAGKGHETYQDFGNEKIHFDDREAVADYLKQLRVAGRKK